MQMNTCHKTPKLQSSDRYVSYLTCVTKIRRNIGLPSGLLRSTCACRPRLRIQLSKGRTLVIHIVFFIGIATRIKVEDFFEAVHSVLVQFYTLKGIHPHPPFPISQMQYYWLDHPYRHFPLALSVPCSLLGYNVPLASLVTEL
ncbi:hypothetical protein BDW02DRAFT_315681 [Decorospora gaudefroyi]|uniref:Uncharacterized protein n=1 Tax=Decorospora gaudefroyi TaxID=184978 RepID=A0A6A5KF87_9PLEO|nr:hypothetical protein BDW02DRAFT_315681 [Decorospora gaudefroyi]